MAFELILSSLLFNKLKKKSKLMTLKYLVLTFNPVILITLKTIMCQHLESAPSSNSAQPEVTPHACYSVGAEPRSCL